eukprot:TRINITY_DN21533_c0_g1_i2.p2 TRINITY_DN21533_c0_g1~~TRINITY_DN21533_c0_g1_i2.p2  ORF type:complete len:243 (-),score=26.19 TRINITY_DN21533_c0_g1_i2:351-1079(-)
MKEICEDTGSFCLRNIKAVLPEGMQPVTLEHVDVLSMMEMCEDTASFCLRNIRALLPENTHPVTLAEANLAGGIVAVPSIAYTLCNSSVFHAMLTKLNIVFAVSSAGAVLVGLTGFATCQWLMLELEAVGQRRRRMPFFVFGVYASSSWGLILLRWSAQAYSIKVLLVGDCVLLCMSSLCHARLVDDREGHLRALLTASRRGLLPMSCARTYFWAVGGAQAHASMSTLLLALSLWNCFAGLS